MKLTIIAGARPNFMKIAPIVHAIHSVQKMGQFIEYRIVHTGQHYDERMSETFFKELNIPKPHTNLECGGGSQAEQTASIMIAFERELQQHPADLVIVVGDVTSTMACSIVAKKLNTKVAHVEAGIRSGDMSMPEEINRIVTDSIADLFFTTTAWASENLILSGVTSEKIHLVGNVMIDTLRANRHRFLQPPFWSEYQLVSKKYIVLTLHRPANVDDPLTLGKIIQTIDIHSGGLPVIFPVHPRTLSNLNQLDYQPASIHTVEPLGYLEFNYLVENALGVITDSGGITEETTVMGVPCMTLRDTTERPETVEMGTNELLGTDPAVLPHHLEKLLDGNWKKGCVPDLWDGHAAKRIVDVLCNLVV
jgi:UDP-N-acetylglucosamine 2-epimerase (non-hydrolysing)